MNFCPPKPGLTVITRTKSQNSIAVLSDSAGVAGLMAMPAFAPPSRIICSARCRCGSASTWIEIMSAPASRKRSM